MNLLQIIDAALNEIDHEIRTTPNPTPARTIIWTLAARELRDFKIHAYGIKEVLTHEEHWP